MGEGSQKLTQLKSELETRQAGSRVSGLIGSAMSARSKADEFVENGNTERAQRRLESALKSLDEAADINERHELGKKKSIQEKRSQIEELLEEVSIGPVDRIQSLSKKAEEAVETGIEARKQDDYETAVSSFEDALDTYESALELASKNNMEEEWEMTQRHSMISEYLEETVDEFEEKRRIAKQNIRDDLDAARTAIRRAEQLEEVADYVAARESFDEGIQQLDEATRIIETGLEDQSIQDRYENLLDRAESVKDALPDDDGGDTYRNGDLIESLQELSAKIDESPTPEFVSAYGEYPADAYLDAFGSWPETLAAANLDPVDEQSRERRKYSRVEILDAVRDLADEFGRPPKKAEMNELGQMSSTTVENRFVNWETAIELADIEETGPDRSEPTAGDTDDETEQRAEKPVETDQGILGEIQDEVNDLFMEESD